MSSSANRLDINLSKKFKIVFTGCFISCFTKKTEISRKDRRSKIIDPRIVTHILIQLIDTLNY